jgi:CRP-like cAMP-binding protein
MAIKSKEKKEKGLIDIIMDIPFFEMLKADELAVVAKHMNYFEIDKDETLFKEGDKGDSVCFVISGALDIYKESSLPGQNVHLATIRKNRSIGEMSVIDEYTRSATVKARTKTSIVALTKSGFDVLLKENPAIGITMLKKIARLLSMNLRSTSSRLADFLLPIT